MVVAVVGDVALVGAPDDDNDGGGSAGSAYVFERSETSWEQSQKLTAGDPGIGDHFGESVAMNHDRILIGASNSDEGGESAGSAYVFRRDATGTAVDDFQVPSSTMSLHSYPNPFQGRTTLSYELSRPGRVRLAVYDVLGRQINVLIHQQVAAGGHSLVFDIGTLPPGVYFARLESAGEVDTMRILHVD